jgi:hypothetical protein
MNIFATSPNPLDCAIALDDKRLIKMILETAQLLSTAIHQYDPDNPALYKPTHTNHPCAVWVREDKRNFQWTIRHFAYLSEEYTARFGKTHASMTRLALTLDRELSTLPPPTGFVNCTPYKELTDVHEAYRVCLLHKWNTDIRSPKWTNRQPPVWSLM